MASSLIRTKEVNDRDFSTVFFFNMLISIFLYSILFFLAPFIAIFFEVKIVENLLKLYGLVIVISTFTITQSVKLNRDLDFKTQFKILLPSIILSGLFGVGAAYLGYGVWSLVIKEIAFAVFASIQLWYYSNWTPLFIFDKNLFKIHFRYGYKLTLTDLISQFFKDGNKIIISKFFSPADLGFFTRAKTMEELPNSVVFNTVNRVMFPLLSKVQDDDIQLKKIYSQIIKVVSFIVVPFLLLLYVIAEPLFVFLITDKWLPAVPYFKILLIAAMIAPVQPYLLNICKVKGRSDLVLKLSMVEYLFIILSLFAIIPYGIIGLLWGLVLATLAKLVVTMFFAGRLINYTVKRQLLDLKEGFSIGVFIFCIVSFAKHVGLFDLMTSFQTIISISILFYTLFLALSYVLKLESFHLIKNLIIKK
ncbi:Membrane protein involved in the export of O-antigen and teichoic acid [Rhodonellum ikkaensis]|nr:Membrane protein involved in the export of O-antigen and teichoic acid [Rhodonellum ikkaensis]